MASMLLLDERGVVKNNLGQIFPDDHLVVPQGWIISWREDFGEGLYRYESKMLEIVHAKDVTIKFQFGHFSKANMLRVEISASTPSAMRWAIEYVTQCIGGRIVYMTTPPDSNSFVRGVANDLRRVRDAFRRLREERQKLLDKRTFAG